MTIKQNGGVFGRNPTFNDVTIEGQLTFDGDIDVSSDLTVDGKLTANEAQIDNVNIDDRKVRTSSAETLLLQGGNNNIGITQANVDSDVALNITAANRSTSGQSQATLVLGANSQTGGNNRAARYTLNVNPNNDFGSSALEFKYLYDGVDYGSRMTLTSSGNLAFPSGNGIDFSAAAGTGSTSELLDDYEEGTWTPTIGGVSVGSGNYTKVGALVFIECLITANSVSTTTINGLPYNLVSAQGYGGVSFGRLYNASVLDANGVPCRVRLTGGDINFRNNAVNATDSNFTITTPASGTVRLGINGVARVS